MTATITEAIFPERILDGALSYYGVPLHFVGDDGDLVMLLGHHDNRRTAAVLNRCYREHVDYPGGPGRGNSYSELSSEVDRTWARLITKCEDADRPGHDPGCGLCREILAATERGGWWVQYLCPEDELGVFPVTLWEVP